MSALKLVSTYLGNKEIVLVFILLGYKDIFVQGCNVVHDVC